MTSQVRMVLVIVWPWIPPRPQVMAKALGFYVTLVATQYSDFSTGPGHSRTMEPDMVLGSTRVWMSQLPPVAVQASHISTCPSNSGAFGHNMVVDLGHFHEILWQQRSQTSTKTLAADCSAMAVVENHV